MTEILVPPGRPVAPGPPSRPPVAPVAPGQAPSPGPSATVPSEAQQPQGGVQATLRRRRLRILAAFVAVAVFALFAWYVQDVVHDYRQRHRAATFATPDAQLGTGDPIGVLQVPEIDLNEVVVEGVGPAELRGGPGRVPGTAILGQRGAMVVMGHSWRYGGPFSSLKSLEKGAEVFFKSRLGTTRAFEVEEILDLDAGEGIEGFRKERLVLVTTSGGPLSNRHVAVVARPVKGQAAIPDVPSEVMSAAVSDKVLRARSLGVPGAAAAILGLALAVACIVGVAVALDRRLGRLGAIAFAAPVGLLLAVLGVFAIDLILPVTF